MNFLKSMGYLFIEPGEGHLACGTSGKGRLPDPEQIVDLVDRLLFINQDLKDKTGLSLQGPPVSQSTQCGLFLITVQERWAML